MLWNLLLFVLIVGVLFLLFVFWDTRATSVRLSDADAIRNAVERLWHFGTIQGHVRFSASAPGKPEFVLSKHIGAPVGRTALVDLYGATSEPSIRGSLRGADPHRISAMQEALSRYQVGSTVHGMRTSGSLEMDFGRDLDSAQKAVVLFFKCVLEVNPIDHGRAHFHFIMKRSAPHLTGVRPPQ